MTHMAALFGLDLLILVLALAKFWFEADCDHRGHAWELRVEPGQMYLQCTVCPKRTPGWDLV